MTNVERLRFSNLNLALDLQGAAGQAAKIVGALFGSSRLSDTALVGSTLAQLDSGAAYDQVITSALADPLFQVLVGTRSNTDFVRLVYRNVVGSPPSQAELRDFVGLLDSGVFTQTSLAKLAADHPLNLASLHFPDLELTGLPYQPVGG